MIDMMIKIPTNSTTHACVHRNSVVAIVLETVNKRAFFVNVMLLGPHVITIKCDNTDDQLTLVNDLERKLT